MFRVVYRQDRLAGGVEGRVFRVIAYTETLEEARTLRKVSGDIVVDEDGKVVLDYTWLFPWETTLCGASTEKNRQRDYAISQMDWQREHPTESWLGERKEVR